MFSPAAYARYQSAVHAKDSLTSSRGRHPSDFCASADDNVSVAASSGCTAGSRRQPGLPENRALNASTTSCTLQKDDGSGPKLTARGAAAGVCPPAPTRTRQPDKGSSTC